MAGCFAFVAIGALQHGVSADQRKAVLVVPDLLIGSFPTFHRVALFASGAELAAVNIGVAVRATGACVLEHQIGVALAAGHLDVHSAQRIAGLVVVEFGDVADRFPVGGGVAVFAGDLDGAVGVTVVFLIRLGIGAPHRRKQQ